MTIALQERWNVWTHFAGALFAISSIWMVWPASELSWQWGLSVTLFVAGMFLMFTSSTVYLWVNSCL